VEDVAVIIQQVVLFRVRQAVLGEAELQLIHLPLQPDLQVQETLLQPLLAKETTVEQEN
jgi:hypothetical protein